MVKNAINQGSLENNLSLGYVYIGSFEDNRFSDYTIR
jgi:hypothetical protein